MRARLKADAIDRDRIRTSLETYIDPLCTVEHPEHIVNVVSGRISPDSVNVENSVTIGKEQMKKYEATWPGGFNDALPIKVITISVTKKEIKIGSSSTFDTELIYCQCTRNQSVRSLSVWIGTRSHIYVRLQRKYETIRSTVCTHSKAPSRTINKNPSTPDYYHHWWLCYPLDYTLANKWNCSRFCKWLYRLCVQKALWKCVEVILCFWSLLRLQHQRWYKIFPSCQESQQTARVKPVYPVTSADGRTDCDWKQKTADWYDLSSATRKETTS